MQQGQWYYYTQGGQQVGPVSFDALQSAAGAGLFHADDFVWHEGDADWQPAHQVAGLFPANADLEPEASPAWFNGYAGFFRRFAAIVIDWLLLSLVTGALIFPLLGVDPASESDMRLPSVQLASALVWWLYFALMECSSLQATLGKRVLNIKVTDMFGRRISFLRATGRHFAKYLSALILFIGFLMAAFTPRRQALHDMLANCLVVRS
ncbi:MAG: RDD family protein [Phycisphaeraceae bacterium]